jgi:hypothetical protein
VAPGGADDQNHVKGLAMEPTTGGHEAVTGKDEKHAASPERAREKRARENREYVRMMLAEKQPEFAALLESVEAELACPLCRATSRA